MCDAKPFPHLTLKKKKGTAVRENVSPPIKCDSHPVFNQKCLQQEKKKFQRKTHSRELRQSISKSRRERISRLSARRKLRKEGVRGVHNLSPGSGADASLQLPSNISASKTTRVRGGTHEPGSALTGQHRTTRSRFLFHRFSLVLFISF